MTRLPVGVDGAHRQLYGAEDVELSTAPKGCDGCAMKGGVVVWHLTKERGAAAVEFGLLLPLLLTLLLGIAEFGYLFNQQISVTQAAREGARAYAIHHGESGFDLNATVQAAASGATATSSPSGGACPSGDTVIVTATKTYRSLTGWFDGILPDDITVTGKGAMRCGG